MFERCPACSAELEKSEPLATQVCDQCGFSAAGAASVKPPGRSPFRSMMDSLVPKAELKNATRDLFSLTGESRPPVISFRGEALPQEAPEQATEGPFESLDPARASQASVMFSLDELKKAAPEKVPQVSLPDQQLWEMQAVTPLFGTADDAALLTAPLSSPQTSVGAVSVPHRQPISARKSLALWVGGGGLSVALMIGAVWAYVGPSSDTELGSEAGNGMAANSPAVASQLAVSNETAAKAAPAKTVDTPVVQNAPSDLKLDSSEAQPAEATRIRAEPPVTMEIKQEPAAKAKRNLKTKKRSTKRTKKARKKRKSPVKFTAKANPGFSKTKAKRALVAAASKASGCGKKTRAGGKGKVRLTFATNGRVKSARIVSARFSGSSTGKCALRHFRAVRIPAFTGKPVTVAKSFRVR